jgi:predicted site-specific integrase-resolvase
MKLVKYFTWSEVQQQSGLANTTYYQYMKSGRIPMPKIKRHTRFYYDEKSGNEALAIAKVLLENKQPYMENK